MLQAFVPDNLRNAVTYSNRYEPGINPTFDDFVDHYDTVIIPTRVREARDRALVENALRLVYPVDRFVLGVREAMERLWICEQLLLRCEFTTSSTALLLLIFLFIQKLKIFDL